MSGNKSEILGMCLMNSRTSDRNSVSKILTGIEFITKNRDTTSGDSGSPQSQEAANCPIELH